MSKLKAWKYDDEYISYIASGESAAVFVVRDIVSSIDTKGKWIDVISLNTYEKSGAGDRKAFNWIIVELFPRKINPKYDKLDPANNRYLTWVTASRDIEEQRQKGYHGDKYLVLCDLYDENKNTYNVRTIMGRKYWEPVDVYRPITIKDRVPPVWRYRIKAVKKVNARQVRYIQDHEYELEGKIRENGRPTLEILGVQVKNHKVV